MDNNDCDVVVIGAGIGGLGTAAILSQAGLRVIVLERAKDVGGRAYSFTHRGHTTNVGGPRAGLEGGKVDQLFARLGTEPGERGFFDGVVHFREGGFQDLTTLALGAPPDELAAFGAAVAGVTPEDLPRLDSVPADMWLAEHVTHPDLIDTARLAGIVLTSAPSLSDISASALHECLTVVLGNPRIYIAANGYGEFTGILADTVAENGGEVRTGCIVQRIGTDGGRITSVEFSDRSSGPGSISTRNVVASFPMWELPALLDDGALDAGFTDTALGLERRTAIFGLTAAVSEPLYEHRSFVLTDAPRAGHPLAAFMASNVAPGVSPEGEHLFEACCQCDPGLAKDKDALAELVELLEDDLDEMMPGWRDKVIWLNSYIHWVEPSRAAGCYGVHRPSSRAAGIEGLWLAGDSSASRAIPGLECAADSAMSCAGEILAAT